MTLRKIVTSGENHVFAVLLADKVGRYININAGPDYRAPNFHMLNTKVTVQTLRNGEREVILVANCVGHPTTLVMTLRFFHPDEWKPRVKVDAWYIGERRNQPMHRWEGSARRERTGDITLNYLNRA